MHFFKLVFSNILHYFFTEFCFASNFTIFSIILVIMKVSSKILVYFLLLFYFYLALCNVEFQNWVHKDKIQDSDIPDGDSDLTISNFEPHVEFENLSLIQCVIHADLQIKNSILYENTCIIGKLLKVDDTFISEPTHIKLKIKSMSLKGLFASRFIKICWSEYFWDVEKTNY